MMEWKDWLVAYLYTLALAFLVWGSFFLVGRYFAFYQRPLNQQVIIGAACLIVSTAAYLFLTGLYRRWRFRAYLRGRGRDVDTAESASPKTFFRAFVVASGVIAVLGGISLLYSSGAAAALVGAFLCFTGAQVLLWRMGLSLEILGNVPSVVDPPRANANNKG